MSSLTHDNLRLSQLQSALPHPPQYNEATAQKDVKVVDSSDHSHVPRLLRRTSFHVESTPNEGWQDDNSSHQDVASSIRSNDEKRALRNLLTRFGNKPAEAQPLKAQTQKRHDMKWLEQAASVKRWPGNGNPAEPWGKLAKDPELWDPAGDTLVYYGYHRPQASFRVKSSILERTRSEILTSMLQEGFKRTPRSTPSVMTAASSGPGVKWFGLGRRAPSSSSEISHPGHMVHIRHEIHFPAPEGASRIEILRHHITTRNLFALMLNKPLVGLTFYQALVDLLERLLALMPRESNCTVMIMDYLTSNGLHNVCNEPTSAAGLLAYSEDDEVQWPEGWREGFVHCSGMYTRLRELPEFRDISRFSRILLERSHLELQAKIQVAQDRFSTFVFDDMWSSHTNHASAARASFDHFRRFLLQFYEKAFKAWPPKRVQNSDGKWLTRAIVCHLQKDFGALYYYYVDRDVVWAETKQLGEQCRAMVRKKNGVVSKISNDGLDLAKLFVQFDRKHKHPHVPHPYPLLPDSMPVDNTGKAQHKQPLFTSKTKALEKQTAYAYAVASNALLTGPDVATNSLVEAFQCFEKTDLVGETDPRDGRKGRWLLLIGILQMLLHVSPDTPELWFKDNVPYFLMPRLGRTPPWVLVHENVSGEAVPAAIHPSEVSNFTSGNALAT